MLATCAIQSSKLFVKYHKTINKKGKFPTVFVISETNFTVTLSNIRYIGIKRILDKAKVNYLRSSVIQESELKERLEEI